MAADGGYVLAGYSSSINGDVAGNHGDTDVWVVKTDENGTLEWQKSMGGTGAENAYYVITVADGFSIVGDTTSDDGDIDEQKGGGDLWIIKLGGNTASTTDISKNTLTLFPNPNNGTFTIGGGIVLDNAMLNVYSTLGQLVYSGKVMQATVSLLNLAKGVYHVQLTSGKASYNQKIVVE